MQMCTVEDTILAIDFNKQCTALGILTSRGFLNLKLNIPYIEGKSLQGWYKINPLPVEKAKSLEDYFNIKGICKNLDEATYYRQPPTYKKRIYKVLLKYYKTFQSYLE